MQRSRREVVEYNREPDDSDCQCFVTSAHSVISRNVTADRNVKMRWPNWCTTSKQPEGQDK